MVAHFTVRKSHLILKLEILGGGERERERERKREGMLGKGICHAPLLPHFHP
jgi:hypothetical protein